MAAYVVCLTSGGGVPLFTRKTANFKSLPFPVVGSLNGVHMFAKSHDATLLNCVTKDTKVVWREFKESVTLILAVTDGDETENELYEFLEMVFYAMVLLIGMDNIVSTSNVERFKRDLKCCFRIIDALLSQLTHVDDTPLLFGDVTHCIDCIFCPENASLQDNLNAFVEVAYSTYGCLMVHGQVAVATKEWWALDGREMVLLSFLLVSLQTATCHDVPVFLPVGSPTVPHRLVVFQLVQGIEVCVLCGPTPTLTQLSKEVGRCWKSAYELLKSSLECHPQNFPSSISLDKNILGFILVSHQERRSLCSVNPRGNEHADGSLSCQQRFHILKTYYKLTVCPVFSGSAVGETSTDGLTGLPNCLRHSCQEVYLCAATHKLYALRNDDYQIIVLFSTAVPNYALRSVTRKTLFLLTKGKHFRF